MNDASEEWSVDETGEQQWVKINHLEKEKKKQNNNDHNDQHCGKARIADDWKHKIIKGDIRRRAWRLTTQTFKTAG